MISVLPVTPDDHDAVIGLQVAPAQRDFVAHNADSLRQAEQQPGCVPLAIRADGELVGFAMYALDPDDGHYWLYRLMIDERFQGRGHGRAALAAIIGQMRAIPDCRLVKLGVAPANSRAAQLYQRAGFRPNGEVIDGETVLTIALA